VRTSFLEASKVGGWSALERYPIAEIAVCTGFFIVYFLEVLAERLMKQNDVANYQLNLRTTPCNTEPNKTQPLLRTEDGNNGLPNYHSHGDQSPEEHAHGLALSAEEQKSVTAAIRGFLLVAALSFHSIFEGMAIGLQPTQSDVWFLFTAVIVHELAIMFCIGMEMLASKLRVLLYVIYMVELGLITSVGVGVGILVTEYVHDPSATHLLVIAILQGIAAGTLLYVTFFEILERERHKPGNGLEKLFAILTGFLSLTALEVFSKSFPITICILLGC
jgi:zinc transporter 1/2/3